MHYRTVSTTTDFSRWSPEERRDALMYSKFSELAFLRLMANKTFITKKQSSLACLSIEKIVLPPGKKKLINHF